MRGSPEVFGSPEAVCVVEADWMVLSVCNNSPIPRSTGPPALLLRSPVGCTYMMPTAAYRSLCVISVTCITCFFPVPKQ